jgi:hypothetical protein
LRFQERNKHFCTHCVKRGHQIEKCWTLYPQLRPRQNREDVKVLIRRHVAVLTEADSLAEKFEREFLLMACLNSIVYEDIEVWFMDNGSSCHMTRMRSIFLTFSEIDIGYYVGSWTNTRQAVRGVGHVRFQLESGGFLGIEQMLYVLSPILGITKGIISRGPQVLEMEY